MVQPILIAFNPPKQHLLRVQCWDPILDVFSVLNRFAHAVRRFYELIDLPIVISWVALQAW